MKKSLFSVLFMFGITLAFTALVSGIRSFTQDKIRQNREIKLQRTILGVLDIPIPEDIGDAGLDALFDSRVRSFEVRGTILFQGFEEDGVSVRGYAFPVGGPGFWGPIEGFVAVSADAARLLGLAFSRHSETPGLGGRITEVWFTDQFKDLSLSPAKEGRRFFSLRPAGTSRAPNELDAVTGATNTSRAVEIFLNEQLDEFLKNLWQDLKSRQ